MTFVSLSLSALSGIALGLFYGLFFALQQRRVFSLSGISAKPRHIFLITILFGALRIGLVALTATFLLLSTTIHPILVSMFFLATWIFLILRHKT